MRIVVTDTGLIWNHENPVLQQFQDIVLVVCLEGKAVTEKYECFVSPYSYLGFGADQYGMESRKYQALASVAERFNRKLHYHDDIVFLTDNEPESLYPYHVIQSQNKYNTLHLCTISPFHFEGKARINGHRELLRDLSGLTSILYLNSNKYLDGLDRQTTMPELLHRIEADYSALLPRILNSISEMQDISYFDFASKSYIPVQKGYSEIDLSKALEQITEITAPLYSCLCTLGLQFSPDYPDENAETKEAIEQTVARIDGKKICNYLRELRTALAEANGIPFESPECLSIGPCAGTCEKCDAEAEYLRNCLSQIPEAQRHIPDYKLTEWEVWE